MARKYKNYEIRDFEEIRKDKGEIGL